MAKFQMYAFHPAVVLAAAHVPEHIVAELQGYTVSGEEKYYVLFLGDHTYGVCAFDRVKLLTSAEASKLKNQKKYNDRKRQAFEEAEGYTSYWDLLVERKLVRGDQKKTTTSQASTPPSHTSSTPTQAPTKNVILKPHPNSHSTPSASSSSSHTQWPLAQRKSLNATSPSFPFGPGDFVLATIPLFPMWPAMVVADCHVSDQIKRSLKAQRNPGLKYCYVVLFGDRNFGTCTENEIKEVTKRQIQRGANDKRNKYKQPSYSDALSFPSYWDFMLQINRVSKEEVPYELQSIYYLPPGVGKAVTSKVPSPDLASTSTSSSVPSHSISTAVLKQSAPLSSSISSPSSRSKSSTPKSSLIAQMKTSSRTPKQSTQEGPATSPDSKLLYHPGELVLARYLHFRPSIAVVMANCHVSPEYKKAMEKFKPKSDHVYVLFLSDRTFGVCSTSQVTPLTKVKAYQMQSDNKKRVSHDAYRDTLGYHSYWSLLLELHIVQKDESPYDLVSVFDSPPSSSAENKKTASPPISLSWSTPSHISSSPPPTKETSVSPSPAMDLDGKTVYNSGELVLALFASVHWLPAVVAAECHVPQEHKDGLESLKEKNHTYSYVIFLGDHAFGACRTSDELTSLTKATVETLLGGPDSYNEITKRALDEASSYTDYWKFLVDFELVEKDEIPEELKSDSPMLSNGQLNVLSSSKEPSGSIETLTIVSEDDSDANPGSCSGSDSEPEMMSFPFSPGALVVARFSAFPWLPAVVMANCHVPRKTLDELKSFKDDLCGDIGGYVMFLGDRSFGICPAEDLKPLLKSEAVMMSRRPLSELKMSGYRAATNYVDYWTLLVECGIVGPSDESYLLSGITTLPPLAQRRTLVEKITTIPMKLSASRDDASFVSLKQEQNGSIRIPKVSRSSTVTLASKSATSLLKTGSIYKPGDLVLARFHNFPWWPAFVVANYHVPGKILQDLNRYKENGTDSYYYVMFADDLNFGICGSDSIHHLTHKEAVGHEKKELRADRKKAYKSAMKFEGKYWDLLLKSKVVDQKEKPYHLESIDAVPAHDPQIFKGLRKAPSVSSKHESHILSSVPDPVGDRLPFRPGDCVLAQFYDAPWWPAVIVANYHVSEKTELELQDHMKANDTYYYVMFFGDHDFGVCTSSELKPLAKKKAGDMTHWSKKSKSLVAAAVEAMKYENYWDLLVETSLVDDTETPYILNTIYDVPPEGCGALPKITDDVYQAREARRPRAQGLKDTEPFPFTPGELVLCPYGDQASWPSIVVARCHVSEKDRKELGSDLEEGILYGFVYLMGVREIASCSASELRPLDHEKAFKIMSWKKGKLLEQAVVDAFKFEHDYWSLLIEMGIVDKGDRPYELKTVNDIPPSINDN